MPGTRSEVISLLFSMGVELPPGTKLTDAQLEARLKDALDAAQFIAELPPLPNSPLNPSSLPRWKPTPPDNISLHLRMDLVRKEGHVGEARPQLFENPFTDLKRTLRVVGENWDNGIRCLILQDQASTAGICIRLIEVCQVRDTYHTPLIVLRYLRGFKDKLSRSNVEWINTQLLPQPVIPNVQCTLQEQELLVRLLRQNSERLAAQYKPPLQHPSESDFSLSFVVPLHYLSPKELFGVEVVLNECAWCGEVGKDRCAGCRINNYCSNECQKQDWTNHKTVCKALRGAVWQSFTFRPWNPTVAAGMPQDNFLHITRSYEVFSRNVSYSPPYNTHGSKAFIVKVQNLPLGSPMLIYDRARSVEGNWDRPASGEGAAAFDRVNAVVKTGYMGLKIFMWARRTGEWEMSVALNKLPDQSQGW